MYKKYVFTEIYHYFTSNIVIIFSYFWCKITPFLNLVLLDAIASLDLGYDQGLLKGEVFCQ